MRKIRPKRRPVRREVYYDGKLRVELDYGSSAPLGAGGGRKATK